MTDTAPRRFVAYCRVSTEKQGRSGLGLEAQQQAINAFLRPGDRLMVPVFVEVESGKRSDRPELAKALAKCQATAATLLVAKLGPLARNAEFLLAIVEGSGQGGVVSCHLPTIPPGPVGKFLLTQMAAVAELEAGLISQRTRAALQAAKARGTVLGGVRPGQRSPTAEEQLRGAQAGAEARRLAADHAAHRAAPRVVALQAEGLSLRGIAAALTAEGVPTPLRGAWTATSVKRILARVSEPAAVSEAA